MTQRIVLDIKGAPTLSDIFTQHITDITLEIEAMKLRNLKKDSESIEEHLERISNALTGIMNAKLDLAEKLTQLQSTNN